MDKCESGKVEKRERPRLVRAHLDDDFANARGACSGMASGLVGLMGEEDEELSRTVQEMWVNFAKTSDPGTEKYDWEPYDEITRQTQILGDEIRMVSDPLKEQRVLIEPLLHYDFNGNYMIADYALRVLVRDILVAVLILLILEAVFYIIYRLMKRSAIRSVEKDRARFDSQSKRTG